MINGPYQSGSGEWCADVEEQFTESFEHALVQFIGGGATPRREGNTYFLPKGLQAAEVMNFWKEWVASLPDEDAPKHTGKNPVDWQEYISIHKGAPKGIRRWRFICRPPDSLICLFKIEADGEFVHVIADVQARAQQEVGDCVVEVMPTSGPPRPTGYPLGRDEGVPDCWQPGYVRNYWIDDPHP